MKELSAVVDKLLLAYLPVSGQSVLVTGRPATELVQCIGEKRPGVLCDIWQVEDVFDRQPPSTKYSLALVVHWSGDVADARDERVSARKLLSRVRDVFVLRILHLVISQPATDLSGGQLNWSLTDSLAMGFVKLAEIQCQTGRATLYDFDIRCYKPEPDWLNAKHWAHPGRWGKSVAKP